MTNNSLDARYYDVVSPGSFAEQMAVIARDAMYNDFQKYCAPNTDNSLINVGVSDVITAAANFIERLYPHPQKITAAGLGDAAGFNRAYPLVSYVKITANEPLPFADKAFSVSLSNAVLEHVGSVENQRNFIAELARVAEQTFITVPHRYFPVEPHTGFPLLHYWDASFKTACNVFGKKHWASTENLILMTTRRLNEIAPAGRRITIGRTGLNSVPSAPTFSSTSHKCCNPPGVRSGAT